MVFFRSYALTHISLASIIWNIGLANSADPDQSLMMSTV